MARLNCSARTGSLLEYTRVTRVEPIALIDNSISHLPVTEDVCRTMTALFAAYYLQGIALSVNVGNIETVRMLEKLNPSRDPIENIGLMFGAENYKLKLPRFDNDIVSTESVNLGFEFDDLLDLDEEGLRSSNQTQHHSQKQIADVASNLSTGIMLNVEVEQSGDKVSIPVSVRLIATPSKPSVLKQLVSYSSKNRTMKERWHGWRSGELNFITDIVFCQDLIDAHKEALVKDDSGQYAEIVSRKNKNRLSGLLSMSPSVSTASNILIIDQANAREIEQETGVRFDSYRKREKLFESAYLMLIAIIDTRHEMVTIYHRGIKLSTEISFKELKGQSKGSNVDVNEILKAYQLNDAPAF